MTHYDDLKILNQVKDKIKNSQTYLDLCKEHDVDPGFLDLFPMRFGPLEVSARTDHGQIIFNESLRDKLEELPHYMIHEVTHVLQQCFGDGPTKGSTDDTYLSNAFEQDGFQEQTKYLSETEGDEAAEKYIDKVLHHHNVPKKEREERREELLQLAREFRRTKLANLR